MRRLLTTIAASVVVLAGCTGVASTSDGSRTAASGNRPAAAGTMSVLFVQNAQSGALDPVAGTSGGQYDLRLDGVDPSTTWFSDRPERRSGSQRTDVVTSEWSAFGFTADPPNAALVLHDRDDRENSVILELREPAYDATARQLRYRATVLTAPKDGLASAAGRAPSQIPAAFASASLFIDDAAVTASADASDLQGTNVPGTVVGSTAPSGTTPGGGAGAGSTVGLCTFPGPVPLPAVAPGGQPVITTQGPGAMAAITAPGVAPTLAQAYTEFNDLQCTHYQHTYVENPAAGLYYYDCVGFTAYAVRVAAPTAWQTVTSTMGIRAGYVPSPQLFQEFFTQQLPAGGQPGWDAVPTAAAIQPGDVLAWIANTTTDAGHSVMALSTPVQIPMASATSSAGATGDTAYALIVMDSTATDHGPDDTRRADAPYSSRNAPLGSDSGSDGAPVSLTPAAATAPSGLGIGTIALIANASGQVTGIVWSLGTATEPVPFGAGHPTS